MSGNRISKYVAAVSSGYANVAANIAFTFLSLRLASDHLNPESFGVWMVAADAANFFSLFELGISNGLIQQFVQHGKEKAGEGYRLAIGSAWLLFGILSCMLLIGVGFTALILPQILGLPPGLVGEFQSVLAALGFGWFIVLLTKPFSLALLADHRMATLNLGTVLSFVTNLVVTTLLLRSGFGIMALVAGNLSGVAASSLSIIVHCIRLSLMPAVDRWMRPSWPDLVEPLRYGLQVLMINLGMNLVFFSRTMAVSRALGLAEAGVWAVMQRPFTMAYQICWKPLEMSFSHLVELHVSGQKERLRDRFRAIFQLSLGMAVCGAAMLAACNRAFVDVWHEGRFSWPWYCDGLLGLLLIPLTVSRCASWLLQAARDVRNLPQISLIEGFVMAGAGFLGAKFAGFTGALLSSLFVASLVGGIYGLERIRGLFSTESPDGIRPWWEPSLKMGLMLVPLVALSGIIFHEQSALFRLVGAGLMVGGGSAFLLFKIGLSESFRTEIANRFRRRSG